MHCTAGSPQNPSTYGMMNRRTEQEQKPVCLSYALQEGGRTTDRLSNFIAVREESCYYVDGRDFVEEGFALGQNFCLVGGKEELFLEFDLGVGDDDVFSGGRATVFFDDAFFKRAFVGADALREDGSQVPFGHPL